MTLSNEVSSSTSSASRTGPSEQTAQSKASSSALDLLLCLCAADFVPMVFLCFHPHLFHIRWRSRPSIAGKAHQRIAHSVFMVRGPAAVQQLAIYYCLNGAIFRCPDLGALINSRMVCVGLPLLCGVPGAIQIR